VQELGEEKVGYYAPNYGGRYANLDKEDVEVLTSTERNDNKERLENFLSR